MDSTLPFLFAVALAGGIWGLLITLRAPTLHVTLAILLVAYCFGPEFGTVDLGPINLSLDRLAILFLLCFGVLKRVLTDQPRIVPERTDMVLALFVLILLTSALLHPWVPRLHRPAPWYRWISSFAAPAIMYGVMRVRQRSPADVWKICAFFAIVGVYLAITAMGEVYRIPALVFPPYILKPHNLYWGRATGPLISSPALGTWLTIASAAALLLLGHARRSRRILLFAVLPLYLFAEYLTKTRSAWIGLMLAVPIALVESKIRIPKATLVVLFIAVGLIAGLIAGEDFIAPERVEGQGAVAMSTSVRLSLAERTLALFLQKPLFGWGFGQFEHASEISGGGGPLEIVPSEHAIGVASHNVLLRMLAETGLFGTSVFLVLYGSWLVRAIRVMVRAPSGTPDRTMAVLFLAAFVAYWAEATFHDVTFLLIPNLTLFFLAACLRAPAPIAAAAPAPQPELLTPDRPGLRLVRVMAGTRDAPAPA